MENLRNAPSNVLTFCPNTLQEVRKVYELDQPGKMSEAIDILEVWVQKQDHFMKKDFSREFLERVIILSKGQLERAKSRLDTNCTKRTLMSRYVGVYNVKDFTECSHVRDFVLPKLTSENRRIYLAHIGPLHKITASAYNIYYKKCIIAWDFVHRYDYCDGYHMIYDLRQVNLAELATCWNPSDGIEIVNLFLKGFSARAVGIHLITTSTFISNFMSFYKQVLSRKLISRMHIHRSLDTLYDMVPKDLLPEEYGGKEKSIEELNKNWMDQLSSEDHLEYLKMLQNMRTDESRRSDFKFTEQFFGTPGTFRNLVID